MTTSPPIVGCIPGEGSNTDSSPTETVRMRTTLKTWSGASSKAWRVRKKMRLARAAREVFEANREHRELLEQAEREDG